MTPVLATRPLPVTVDARFDELRRSPTWTDDYVARVAEVFAHPRRSVHGWEAADDALARFLAGIADLRVQFPNQILALVGHGLTFSLYRAHLLHRDRVELEDWKALSFAAVARQLAFAGYAGLEWACGIPGTLGGAVGGLDDI